MAREFNGTTSDYISCGNPSCINFTGDTMSASIWVRKHTSGGSKPFGRWHDSQGQQWLIELGAYDLLFALYISGSGVKILNSNPNVLTVNKWHHIVVTYDGSNQKIFVDGVQQGSRSQSGNIVSVTSAELTIGIGSNLDGPLNGDIGHATLWDRALLPNEVVSLSNGINPLQIPNGLVLYNPLNGQSPEPDIVGGTLGTVNGTTVVDEPPIPNSIKAP